jgi:Resolvase, N terminal domain
VRAALYARVSTEAQADRGTIGSQLQLLRAHIAAAGDELVGEYVDDGYSGARLDRPGLDALRDAAEAGLVVRASARPAHLRLSRRQLRRQVPTIVRSTCPIGVLRHLVTRKHVRDTSARRRVAGRHYPIHRRRCDTLQHRHFHTGSVGVGGSSPLSSYLSRSGRAPSPPR